MTTPDAAGRESNTLRSDDWRFLLPLARPRSSIAFGGGPLWGAVAAISAQVVDPGQVEPASCDLAAAHNPDLRTMKAAWRALQMGGAFYSQWPARPGRTPASVRRRLRAAGFQDVRCYLPWPSARAAQFWLPLDTSAPARYLFAARPASGAAGAVRTAIRWLARHGGVQAAVLLPFSVVACKTPEAGEQSCSAPFAQALAGTTLRSSSNLRGDGTCLLLTHGSADISKVVALIFPPDEVRPEAAVKMSRVPEAAPLLRREAETLRALQTMRPALEGVPRLLYCGELEGVLAVVETVVDGTHLSSILGRDTYRDLALLATRWSVQLAGRPQPQPPSTWWKRLVEPIVSEFEASFGPVVDRGALLQARAALSSLGPLPVVPEQRDFSPWNILLDDEGMLGVLDWESAELQGLPALDLIYFLTYLAFFVDGAMQSGRFRESYRRLLDDATPTGDVRDECCRLYLQHLGMGREHLHPLRLLTWMVHARSELRRFRARGEESDPNVLRGSLFLSLWQEELLAGDGVA